jgi:hypothetical protein
MPLHHQGIETFTKPEARAWGHDIIVPYHMVHTTENRSRLAVFLGNNKGFPLTKAALSVAFRR